MQRSCGVPYSIATIASRLNAYSRKIHEYILRLSYFSSIFLFFVDYRNFCKHFRPVMKEIILQTSNFRCRENIYI